jgi:hypothetical protein
MADVQTPERTRGFWPILLAAGGLLGGTAILALFLWHTFAQEPPPPPVVSPATKGDATAEVHRFCAACHLYPPPETFPRSAWKDEVERGYLFFNQSGMPLQPPPIDLVVKYYEDRAPLELPVPATTKAPGPAPVRFEPTGNPGPPVPPAEASPGWHVSNVNLVHLFDERRLDVLAMEMSRGLVMALKPYEASPAWQVLGKVPNPAHAEVVDLDGDGIKDILVADLGSFLPTDRRSGSVVWLRGTPDGRFTPITLLDGVGRVADVQAADFRGTGKLDLVVAVFGWHTTGEILLLENHTTDWAHPRFERKVLDPRHGAIHVPVTDLNGDGKPDFIALISQEHETVVAFLNKGGGNFEKETIYTGPHPAYGSSGIQLVDMNGDGHLDVLYTNGDVLDQPYLLKPYHSIQWLENPGNGHFPWKHHPVAPMYGVHRAVAADFRGTGKKDIVAVNFLPVEAFPQRKDLNLDSVVLLEETAPDQWTRHSLETVTCDHVTCAVGDLYGSGHLDLVTGNFTINPVPHPVTIWKNLGAKAPGR